MDASQIHNGKVFKSIGIEYVSDTDTEGNASIGASQLSMSQGFKLRITSPDVDATFRLQKPLQSHHITITS